MREGAAIGAIVLRRTEARLFSERQIALLQTFADQAVIAIENVRLFEKEQQRTRELGEALEQQTATSEVLRVISNSPGELEPVFQTMLANAVQICGAKFGVTSLREGDAFRVIATHGAPSAFVEQRRREPLIRPTPGHNLERKRHGPTRPKLRPRLCSVSRRIQSKSVSSPASTVREPC